MKSTDRFKDFKIFFLFVFFWVVYSIQVLPRLSADSLTNDEPAEITNGYYYLTQGDVWTPHLHPPLASALMALPLLLLHLNTFPVSGDVIDRAHHFIFDWNGGKIFAVTTYSRWMNYFFGFLIGLTLFGLTRKDKLLCGASLFLWALNPTLLGLAGVAKIEIIPAFFFLTAVVVFQKSLENPKLQWSLSAGVLTGMAVMSKLYCLTLIPIFLILEWRNRKNKKWTALDWARWGWGLAGFALLIFCIYLPAFLLAKNTAAVLGNLPEKFAEDFVFAAHPFPVYFFGRCTLESHWYYLPVAFLLKEPLPFILVLGLTVFLALFKKIHIPSWQWIPALVFGIAVLPATNLGIRYWLPLYPFLFLIGARGLVWLWREGKEKRFYQWILGGIFLWQAVSVGINFPHVLSYFNELVPSDGKLYYLADSNLDWGQDLKRLADKARERNWGKVKLAYLGGTDPKVYGLDWEPFQPEDLLKPQPGTVYAVNASFFQLAPVAYPSTLNIVKSWLSQTEPTGQVADSWFYFEIPGKRAAVKNEKWLPSVPFLQYRGYCPYPLNRGE